MQSGMAHSCIFARPFVLKWQIHYFHFFWKKLSIFLESWNIKMQNAIKYRDSFSLTATSLPIQFLYYAIIVP